MGKLPHLCWAQGHQHLISFSCFVELDCEDWWHHCGKWNNMGTDSQCSVYTHTYSLMSWRERVLWGHPTWTGMAPPTFVSCETLSNQPGFQESRFLIGKTDPNFWFTDYSWRLTEMLVPCPIQAYCCSEIQMWRQRLSRFGGKWIWGPYLSCGIRKTICC